MTWYIVNNKRHQKYNSIKTKTYLSLKQIIREDLQIDHESYIILRTKMKTTTTKKGNNKTIKINIIMYTTLYMDIYY